MAKTKSDTTPKQEAAPAIAEAQPNTQQTPKAPAEAPAAPEVAAPEAAEPEVAAAKAPAQAPLEVANAPALQDVNELISAKQLQPWQGAALCRAENWAPGKQVTNAEFDAALQRLTHRPMGR